MLRKKNTAGRTPPRRGYQKFGQIAAPRNLKGGKSGGRRRTPSAGPGFFRRHRRVLLPAAILILILVAGGLLYWFVFSSPTAGNTGRRVTVLQLTLTSTPAGAAVFMDGVEKGIAPLKIGVDTEPHFFEVRLKGYATYYLKFQVDKISEAPKATPQNKNDPIPSQVTSVAASSLPATATAASIGLSTTGPGSDSGRPLKTGTGTVTLSPSDPLPEYVLTADLSPARVALRPLPKPLPGARLEYARYLGSPDSIELTYLDAQGSSPPPGTEGLPTNLWLYHPASLEQPRPVVFSFPTLDTVARYSELITGTETPWTTSFLGGLAFSDPVLDPQAKRLAFISNRLTTSGVSPAQSAPSGVTPQLKAATGTAVATPTVRAATTSTAAPGATLAAAETNVIPATATAARVVKAPANPAGTATPFVKASNVGSEPTAIMTKNAAAGPTAVALKTNGAEPEPVAIKPAGGPAPVATAREVSLSASASAVFTPATAAAIPVSALAQAPGASTNSGAAGVAETPAAATTPAVATPVARPTATPALPVAQAENSNQPPSTLPPVWDDQAIWVAALAEQPSTAGAILTGPIEPERSGTESPLFSLQELSVLMPGIVVPGSSPNNTYQSGASRFASIRQLSWAPGGTKLLAVIEIRPSALSGSRSGGSTNSTATIMVLINAGEGSEEGKAVLVTPQPLGAPVLPGTFVWNSNESAVSFLLSSGQTSGSGSGQAALCVLDLPGAFPASGSRVSEEASGGQPEGDQGQAETNPFHYLAQLSAAGVWNASRWSAAGEGLSNQSLLGGQVYPPSYGQFRYNPFTWPARPEDNAAAGRELTGPRAGLFSAPGQNTSSLNDNSNSSQLNINQIFLYVGIKGVSQVVPFVADITAVSGSPKALSNGGAAEVKTGSFPYWQNLQKPLYLAIRPLTDGKNKGGGILGSGSKTVWQLSVETFNLPASFSEGRDSGAGRDRNREGKGEVREESGQGNSDVEKAAGGETASEVAVGAGIVLHFSGQSSPMVVGMPDSADSSLPDLGPGKLEAVWQPGGKGFLVVLPSSSGVSSSYRDNNLWLVTWP